MRCYNLNQKATQTLGLEYKDLFFNLQRKRVLSRKAGKPISIATGISDIHKTIDIDQSVS